MGDSSLSVPSEEAPDPYGPHCRSQEDRAERFTRMFNDLFARPLSSPCLVINTL